MNNIPFNDIRLQKSPRKLADPVTLHNRKMSWIMPKIQSYTILIRTDTVGVYFFEHGIPGVKHLVDIVYFFRVPADLILNDTTREQ